MRKSLLIAGLALAASSTSYANIADTLAQSAARYGEPWRHYPNTNIYYYLTGSYLIVELIPASSGVVEYIEYTKLKGVIDADETTKILTENLPAFYIEDNHWKLWADDNKDNSRMLVSVDEKCGFETGWDAQAGDSCNSYLSISTPLAYREIMAVKHEKGWTPSEPPAAPFTVKRPRK